MHEYSVVSSLISLCEEQAIAHSAHKIITITIEIGECSGVNAELLERAFGVFKEESEYCKSAVLRIVRKKVELLCNNCGARFAAEGFEFAICPYCESNAVDICGGKELDLLSLEME